MWYSGASVLQKPPHGHWLPIQVSGVSERWAMKKKTMKKQFWQSHEDEIDNTRYPCCGMVVGPGEGKGCTSTHPCCGAAQVLLFCFWLCQAKSAAPSANATMFSVGIRKPNSWGAYKKKVIFGGLSANAPSQWKKCGPYSREKFSYLFFVENWILHVWIGFYKSHTAANLSLPILSIETVFWTINALFHGIYCLSHREKAKWGCFLG